MPKETVQICRSFFEGNIKESAKLQLELLPLINALFCEVNPIPVKAAMEAMGFCTNEIRLPLTPMEDANREKLLTIMRSHNIID
jgi:4-hydroxy-tetrahydrodipicolinate synthase